MKNQLWLIWSLLLPCISNSQTTTDYFSRPGLSINAYHLNFFDGTRSTSWTYIQKTTQCDNDILWYAANDGYGDLYLLIEDKKVYAYDVFCQKHFLYDFGVAIGDTIKEGFFKEFIVSSRDSVLLINGEKRLRIQFSNIGTEVTTWIEGLGDVNRGLFPQYDFEGYDQFVCAKDSTGELWYHPEELENCPAYSCLIPRPAFSVEQNEFRVSFHNESLFARGFEWNFGNSIGSTDENPVYDYSVAGCYIVDMNANNDCHSNGMSTSRVLPICIAPDWDTMQTVDFLHLNIYRFSTQLQFLLGGYTVYRSTDNGLVWQNIDLPYPGLNVNRFITGIQMYDHQRGIITCGNYGVNSDLKAVLITTDGGLSWNEKDPGTSFTHAITLGENGKAWITDRRGGLYSSNDYGETWIDLQDLSLLFFNSIQNFGDSILIGLLINNLVTPIRYFIGKSTDGGQNWDIENLPSYIAKFFFVTPLIGYGYTSSQSGLLKTTNGGNTWQYVSEEIHPFDFIFSPADEGWIADHNGIVYYTDDGMNSYRKTNCGGGRISSLSYLAGEPTIGIYRNYILSFTNNTTFTCSGADQDNDGYSDDADCNDEDPGINPGETEIPDNGIDEDCDGKDLLTQTYNIMDSDYMIYPNPVSDLLFITVDLSVNVEVMLYDFTGQVKFKHRGDAPIDVSSMAPGIYFVMIIQEDLKHISKKIVIH